MSHFIFSPNKCVLKKTFEKRQFLLRSTIHPWLSFLSFPCYYRDAEQCLYWNEVVQNSGGKEAGASHCLDLQIKVTITPVHSSAHQMHFLYKTPEHGLPVNMGTSMAQRVPSSVGHELLNQIFLELQAILRWFRKWMWFW